MLARIITEAIQRRADLAEFQQSRDRIDKSGSAMKHNPETIQANLQNSDDYDPFAHRPQDVPKLSDFSVFVHLLKCAIGTGILFLPHAFRRTGYVMSFVCGVIISMLCIHTATIVVRCSQLLCKRKRVPMLDFAGTARTSFEQGPEWIRKYAHTFSIMTNVFICFVHYQTAVIYILYVSTSFQQVIEFFLQDAMDARVYILIFFPFTCALGFAPDLKCLAPFSFLGSVFLVVGVCIAVYYFLTDIPDPARLNAFTYVLPVPMYCAILLFALHNMTLYLPLENMMKYPMHMPRLIIANMIFNTSIYLTFGFLGYNKYMEACDTVIKNLPLDEALAQIVKIAISLSVLFTLGLAYIVPITVLWPLIYERIAEKSAQYQRIAAFALRLTGILATTLLAIAVPEMVPLLGLLSAISMTTMMLLIPILIETSTMWMEASKVLFLKNFIIFFVWLMILVFGVTESMFSIIREYGGIKPDEC